MSGEVAKARTHGETVEMPLDAGGGEAFTILEETLVVAKAELIRQIG